MIQPISGNGRELARGRSRGPFDYVLRLFSSVWFGVALAVLLFVYCSIGSAIPQVRQHASLEMTEFQWFHWWPFNVLVVLLCVTLVTVTVRRIPLRLVNAGVWTIHSGIILLVVGSYYYFGTKVEGDAPVFRRQVVIERPGMATAERMLAVPGTEARVTVGSDAWRFAVASTNHEWPILSEEHKGQTAFAVNVQVTPPNGEPFIRQLLAGYPQYTEDVLPGKGRAIKIVGKKLVDEELKLSLDYEPQTHFHVMDTWALYVRKVGDTQWAQRPIEGMPRYNDWVSSRDQVATDPHFPIVPRTLDLTVPPAPEGDALSTAPVRVTGYLRYARMQRHWREGSARLNPVVAVSLLSDHAPPESFELVAFDPANSVEANGNIQFVWLDESTDLAELPPDSRPVLSVAVPEKKVLLEVPLTREVVVGTEGPFRPIEGTDFAYRVVNLHDNLVLPNRSDTVSIAMVEIKTPEGQFTRMVADRAEMTRDMHGDADPHGAAMKKPAEADPRIHMTYRPATAPLLFAAHPGGLQFVFNGPSGRVIDRAAAVGDVVELMPGIRVRVDGLWTRAVMEMKPYVVPPPKRDRNAGESLAMIRLEVDTGRGVETEWVPFNQYALPNMDYAYGGRFNYSPVRFRLADGANVEVVFSREQRPLPNAIALDEFKLDTHIGGYTGSASTIRNYMSQLRFWDGGRWTEPVTIAVNHPTEYGGYWYFQSMWDKPPNSDPSAGMNYTGLGVGNRRGVYVQLAGCCLAVAGMIFAFYVKPVIKRRRAEQSRARHQRDEPESVEREAARVWDRDADAVRLPR